MGRRKKNNPLAALVFGPALVVGSVMALWQNEHRFDYHKAAKSTQEVFEVQALSPDQVFSFTGPMDQSLTIPGHYVESFTGFLTVKRRAEIYAWDEDEDSDGNTDWDREWMTSVQSNSRNSEVKQTLSSQRFIPKTFQAGELEIKTDRMEFVDGFQSISPRELTLSSKGQQVNFDVQDNYFYLDKGASDDIGDERISYRALPVPPTATYFGKYGKAQAVAHQAEMKKGFISSIIKDTGVLHHLVAGERETALSTMKAHIWRLKMIVRAAGVAANIMGWAIFFGFFIRFLINIPVIGDLMQTGVSLLSVLFGSVIGAVTILAAYITSHPIILVLILLAAFGGLLMLRRKGRSTQRSLRSGLETQIGHALSPGELKELEFLELIHLANRDGNVDMNEQKYLRNWSKRQGWDDAKIASLIERAKSSSGTQGTASSSRDHLLQLIRLALADGSVDGKELKTIRKAGKEIGCGRKEISQMLSQARRGALAAQSS